MQTKEWGPSLWKYGFILCRNYPEKIKAGDKEHSGLKCHIELSSTTYNLCFLVSIVENLIKDS